MGSESIAHEAEGRTGYCLRSLAGFYLFSIFQSKIGARFGIERLQGMRDAAENKHRHYGD